jgi:hypothetical protein
MTEVEKRKGFGLRVVDGVALVAVGVVAVVLAFWVLSFVAGFLWGVIKLVLVIAVVVAALWWLLGRSKS